MRYFYLLSPSTIEDKFYRDDIECSLTVTEAKKHEAHKPPKKYARLPVDRPSLVEFNLSGYTDVLLHVDCNVTSNIIEWSLLAVSHPSQGNQIATGHSESGDMHRKETVVQTRISTLPASFGKSPNAFLLTVRDGRNADMLQLPDIPKLKPREGWGPLMQYLLVVVILTITCKDVVSLLRKTSIMMAMMMQYVYAALLTFHKPSSTNS